jgi:hypothetical protein
MAKEKAQDFIFTDDLVIQNGDFLVDESDTMHIEHILKADKGQFRQWPLIGVGALRLKGASVDRVAISQAIRVQLMADNFLVKSVKVSSGDQMRVQIDAKRRK